MSFLLHFSTQEDSFYDIGANLGAYALLASGVNKKNTICFESSPSTYECLLEPIKVNFTDH